MQWASMPTVPVMMVDCFIIITSFLK